MSAARWANTNFGKYVYSLSYDEKILKGWGVRPSDWQIGVTVQQEILPRVSLEVGYTRRWLENFTVTDNRALSPGRLRYLHRHRTAGFASCPAAAGTLSRGSIT